MSRSLSFFLSKTGVITMPNRPSHVHPSLLSSLLSTRQPTMSFLEHKSDHSISLLKTFHSSPVSLRKEKLHNLADAGSNSTQFILPLQPYWPLSFSSCSLLPQALCIFCLHSRSPLLPFQPNGPCFNLTQVSLPEWSLPSLLGASVKTLIAPCISPLQSPSQL